MKYKYQSFIYKTTRALKDFDPLKTIVAGRIIQIGFKIDQNGKQTAYKFRNPRVAI